MRPDAGGLDRFAATFQQQAVALRALDLRIAPGQWAFALKHRWDIDRHWRSLAAQNPTLWNGEVLMMTGGALQDGCFSARFVVSDFASLVAWRDWGYPDATVKNCFGSAALVSSDGALLFGEMAPHTANAARIYPPGGSLEPLDVRSDGTIDIVGSIVRELKEETGLDAAEADPSGNYAIGDGPRISIARVFRFEATAAALIGRVARHLESQARPELRRMVAVRRPDELPAAGVPGYARILAQALLAR